MANKKSILLSLDLQPKLPALFADEPKFKQIFKPPQHAIKLPPTEGRSRSGDALYFLLGRY